MNDFVVKQDPAKLLEFPGAHSYQHFEKDDTPIKGVFTMFNIFYSTEYPAVPGVHDDNEGFYVVSGEGTIKIKEKEYDMVPGAAILVPAGTPHAIRKKGNEDLKVFIYHFPL